MPGYTCDKCNKTFNKKLNYERHINKKVPCDKEEYYICEKCNKEFFRLINYEQHLARKTSCVKNIENNTTQNKKINKSELQLQIEKEKTKQAEERTKREIEKEQEKTKRELEKLKLKIELNKQESENKQKEIELRRLKNLDIELAKDKRKEKTATIINNDNRVQNINNTINIINNMYYNDQLITNDKAIKKQIENHSAKLCNFMVDEWYEKSNHSSEFIEKLLSFFFNNEKFPEMNIIIYDVDSSEFFLAEKDGFKHIEFKNINPYIVCALQKSLEKISTIIEPPRRGTDAIIKYNIFIKANLNNLKSVQHINSAKNALNPSNKFKLDENKDVFGQMDIDAYEDEYD